jgi:hypothetical protein
VKANNAAGILVTHSQARHGQPIVSTCSLRMACASQSGVVKQWEEAAQGIPRLQLETIALL